MLIIVIPVVRIAKLLCKNNFAARKILFNGFCLQVYPKLSQTYYVLLECLAQDHMNFLSTLEPNVFLYILSSISEGLSAIGKSRWLPDVLFVNEALHTSSTLFGSSSCSFVRKH